MTDVRNIVPPSLPSAPQSYERRWVDQFSNVLRLFFTTVTNAVNALIAGKMNGTDGGWRDMIGQAGSPTAGPTIPIWTQMGATAFYAYVYQVNDQQWFFYHIQHDYSPGTPIFLHAHWMTNGTSTAVVKWEFTWSYAKGFNQENYDLTGTVYTAQEAAAGSAWRHMVTETSVSVPGDGIEVDGILMVRLRRVTNGGADNADTVFLTMADCHYQSDTFNTKNRSPNFYT